MEDKIQKVSVGVEAESYLDSIPFLKQDSALPRNDLRNTERAVIYGVMRPLAFFLVEQSRGDPSKLLLPIQTPQELIAVTVRIPALGLGDEEKEKLLAFFGPGEVKEWKEIAKDIALDISLLGIKHPLQQLSQAVKEQLSKPAKAELTRLEMSSH